MGIRTTDGYEVRCVYALNNLIAVDDVAQGRNILDYLDLKRYTILPNTAGCFSAEDAIRHARLARELLTNLDNPGAAWVKRFVDIYPKCIWLNPEPEEIWNYRQSIGIMKELVNNRMYPTTLAGLEKAMKVLAK